MTETQDNVMRKGKRPPMPGLIDLLALCALGTIAGLYGYSSTARACGQYHACMLHGITALFVWFCTGTALLAAVRALLGEVRTLILRIKRD